MADPIIANKQTIQKIFDDAAARYDRAGTPLFEIAGARLVELLEMAPGARVLDIATGIGAVLLPAAARVGASGRVIGIDFSEAMLAQARAESKARGFANVVLRQMDAEQLDFPKNTFDAVTCGFALFLMPAMEKVLREMRRVCKPAGRVGLTLWGKDPFDPAWKIVAEQLRAYGMEVRMPHKIAYAAEEIRAMMAGAGFGEIETREEKSDAHYASEEEWWQFQMTTGVRAAIAQMTEETHARFKAEYLEKLRPLKRADGSMCFPAPVVYTIARK